MGVSHQIISPTRGGTHQKSRLSEKLLPDYVNIDERSTSDLLAFIAEYAGLVDFYNNKNLPKGTWEPFFRRDISVFLASVISADISKLDSDFEHLVQKVAVSYKEIEKCFYFSSTYQFLMDMARMFNSWLVQILDINRTGGELEDVVELEFRKLINQSLFGSLQKLYAYSQAASKYKRLHEISDTQFAEFHPMWRTYQIEDHEVKKIFSSDTLNENLNVALVELRFIYRTFYNSLVYLQSNFQKFFDRSIEDKDDHKPDVGLFIAFLKLFRFAQKDLNLLTKRHLEFYYQHVLGEDSRDSISDEINVLFELARTTSSHQLPAGTMLTAGLDETGRDILYRIKDDVELNKAQIDQLKTVFVSRILENQVGTYKLVTGHYSAPYANSKDGRGEPMDRDTQDWPLFGEEQYKSGVSTMSDAPMGLGISSPIFFMQEGNRRIKIEFHFKQESTGIYRKLIEDLANEASEDGYRYAFFEVFGRELNSAFDILVSGPKGWINIKEEASNLIYIEYPTPWRWDSFTLNFTIPASSPAVVPFGESGIRGEQFGPRFPVVKLLLNPGRTPYLYSFLEYLELSSLDIQVDVDRLKRISVYNDIGRLDGSQPFQPFGPTPSVGSYLLVGNPELFQKAIDDLEFTIEWQNLPVGGLDAHYADYFPAGENRIRDDAFELQLSALSGNEFKPEEPDTELCYAMLDDEGGKALTEIKVEDPSKLEIKVDADLTSVSNYDNTTPNGFFKFELNGPREAFGHRMFSERFAEVARENADPDANPAKYPNQPYTPVVRTLTMRYAASDQITLEKPDAKDRVEVYHIHPFGTSLIFSRNDQLVSGKPTFVPTYNDDGYLYIGIKDLRPPQDISMLFQLVASNTHITNTSKLPSTSWSFLSRNRWEPLKDAFMLQDTTDGFTTTGIIRVHIPGGITRRNTLLPSGLYWLRVKIDGDPANVCRAVTVRTQAATAEWVSEGDPNRLRRPLAPNSVDGLLSSVSKIRNIYQPFSSFNGLSSESSEEFYTRVSERLRHKSRAVSHWDFERLIMDRFHTIFQVKCLSHLTDPEFIPAGEIRVVVVPGINHATDNLTPKVNHKTLMEIQHFLKSNCSPFVNLRVVNPVYEYLRVICSVKFTEGRNNGHSLERLKKDIEHFICPWLENPEVDMGIGGSLKVDTLQNYIRGLSYVRFVTKFAIQQFYVPNEETGEFAYQSTADPTLSAEQREVIKATKPWSVLIPDADHQIEITQYEQDLPPDFSRRPVNFQNRIQITQSHIKIIRKMREEIQEANTYYDQNDTLTIYI